MKHLSLILLLSLGGIFVSSCNLEVSSDLESKEITQVDAVEETLEFMPELPPMVDYAKEELQESSGVTIIEQPIDIKYNENYEPELRYTVKNKTNRRIVAFELGHYLDGGKPIQFAKVKHGMNPGETYNGVVAAGENFTKNHQQRKFKRDIRFKVLSAVTADGELIDYTY